MFQTMCKEHTNLSISDIQKLEKIKEVLPHIADLVGADIFLDCLTKDSNMAVVLAQSKPSNNKSMYKESIIGQLALRENEPATLRTLNTGIPTRDLKAITQENKKVVQSTIPIKNDKEEVIGVLIMEQDLTDNIKKNRQMEILSQTTEELTKTLVSMEETKNIISYLNEAIIIFDKEGIATYVNPGAKALYKKLGYQDAIRGMRFDNLVLDKTPFDKIIKEASYEMSEVKIGRLSLQIKYAIMKRKEKVVGVNMLIKDITEAREKEKELILKSVAIKEIHHRVKNNLQTIASLLRLQSRRIDDDTVKKAFNESISRILSIAVTHELLAQEGVDDVDIKTILNKIKSNTLNYVVSPNKEIKVEISGDRLTVDSDKATSRCLSSKLSHLI
ncbi:histidine kinase N-terminal domain-containing protein [Dethiothermospora halolimnae]|uniref:sensor histidine kinase n=1 Tax=Dethiothermospora halolimnae TaxID=3114390 RepID=UPI003CCC04D6